MACTEKDPKTELDMKYGITHVTETEAESDTQPKIDPDIDTKPESGTDMKTEPR